MKGRHRENGPDDARTLGLILVGITVKGVRIRATVRVTGCFVTSALLEPCNLQSLWIRDYTCKVVMSKSWDARVKSNEKL